MNLNLEGKASKLAWGLGIVGSLVLIISSIYWISPTVQDSLEDQELQLISKSEKSVDLYKRSFRRHKNTLISIGVDDFISENTVEDEGSVALHIWCDANLRSKRWLVNLDGYKRFCALSMGDVLWLDKKDGNLITKNNFIFRELNDQRFSSRIFFKFGLTWKNGKHTDNYEIWKSRCESELSEPYSYLNKHLKTDIKDNCFN
ncbi:hypothetical protein HF1_09340 [Mycoplasma haemofelis str. Langford 1]|uniref:Uncharacterized protein n=1 Tax=Mycoplasma haemofelis (strain Langford 1) TaxID=941640 RepID=E8ZIH1_MYCHL|nr:hypothetical protein [Mycoplasma haemofelis]CBY92942.1 hypothetical protein HF1_09340 [Mycoplasma haemofelis str. Langford 1]